MIATSDEAKVKGAERDARDLAEHRARAVRSLRKDGATEAERPLNRYERRNLKHAIRRTS